MKKTKLLTGKYGARALSYNRKKGFLKTDKVQVIKRGTKDVKVTVTYTLSAKGVKAYNRKFKKGRK